MTSTPAARPWISWLTLVFTPTRPVAGDDDGLEQGRLRRHFERRLGRTAGADGDDLLPRRKPDPCRPHDDASRRHVGERVVAIGSRQGGARCALDLDCDACESLLGRAVDHLTFTVPVFCAARGAAARD